jgi:hypothetical protein
MTVKYENFVDFEDEVYVLSTASNSTRVSALRNYARTSFRYATRCGWSASIPFRFRRSSLYD